MRNSKIIEDAFEQIREQQGGGLLNQETDVLEERNKDIDNEIVTFNSLVQLSEDDKLNKLEDMR